MKVIVFGIKNCDTVKKALDHLAKKKNEVTFYDYKKTPPTEKMLKAWKKTLGEYPLNKKGTTYKKVSAEFEVIKDEKEKIQFIIQNSSMLSRPIIEDESGNILSVGKDYLNL